MACTCSSTTTNSRPSPRRAAPRSRSSRGWRSAPAALLSACRVSSSLAPSFLSPPPNTHAPFTSTPLVRALRRRPQRPVSPIAVGRLHQDPHLRARAAAPCRLSLVLSRRWRLDGGADAGGRALGMARRAEDGHAKHGLSPLRGHGGRRGGTDRGRALPQRRTREL